MLLAPYRNVCPPEVSRCGGLDEVCEPLPRRRRLLFARYGFQAIVLTTAIISAGMIGAAAHAALTLPTTPIELGPAAIAKLRRPFPGLMGYGYESHDPVELRKRAIDLAEHRTDLSVSEVRLSDTQARNLRRERDDLSGLEPIIENGKLAAVRVTTGTPFSRAVGLLPGDEISAVNGWPIPLIDDQVLHGDRRMAVLEVSRNGTPMVVCVTWR